MNFEEQLKKLKQRSEQTVSELISYFDTLKDQLSEIFFESQRHSNLLHSFHDYLQRVIIRTNFQNTIGFALIEAARVAERMKFKFDFVRNVTRLHHRFTNEEMPQRISSHQRIVIYNKISSPKTSEMFETIFAQAVVIFSSRKRSREEMIDSSKIIC